MARWVRLVSLRRRIANFLATCAGSGGSSSIYGAQPTAEDAAKISSAPAAVRGNDERQLGWPAYEQALKAVESLSGIHYPGVEHGFNNGTTPRYDEAPQTGGSERSSFSTTSACLKRKGSGCFPGGSRKKNPAPFHMDRGYARTTVSQRDWHEFRPGAAIALALLAQG
jgi:hypothetical protein